jgi:putative oxidoreductase
MADSVGARTGWDDLGKLILRLTVAVLLGLHGVAKVKGGVGFISGLLAQNGLPGFLAYGAYVGEIVAPILLILGILTRPAALLVIVQMLFAIFLARRGDIFTIAPVARGGGWAIELEMFFILAALAIFFFGAGRYSLAKRPGRWD